MTVDLHSKALVALLTLARQLTQAAMTAAMVQRTPGTMVPFRSEPPLGLRRTIAWRWAFQQKAAGWYRIPLGDLPSLVKIGLPFVPAAAVYLDCADWGERAIGGVLLLWDDAHASHAAAFEAQANHPALLLRPLFARLLEERHLRMQGQESDAQFDHIFNSVPHGIVVVAGHGAHAKVNLAAARLLRLMDGAVDLDMLAEAMRLTRARCANAAQLDAAYEVLRHEFDAKVEVDWELDDQVWKVDTHPILDSADNGRVWLFQDITAQVRLEQMLRREAAHDLLTGLFNRRAFFDKAQVHYLAHARDADAPQCMALLMFDIDHFKSINDSFGHLTGDAVLQEIADRAQTALRDSDLLARYGGEEFIALLPQTSAADALAAAERLCQVVRAGPVQVEGLAIEVRISVGLTMWRGASEKLASTIARADGQLYRAKREGRDRVADDVG